MSYLQHLRAAPVGSPAYIFVAFEPLSQCVDQERLVGQVHVGVVLAGQVPGHHEPCRLFAQGPGQRKSCADVSLCIGLIDPSNLRSRSRKLSRQRAFSAGRQADE